MMDEDREKGGKVDSLYLWKLMQFSISNFQFSIFNLLRRGFEVDFEVAVEIEIYQF